MFWILLILAGVFVVLNIILFINLKSLYFGRPSMILLSIIAVICLIGAFNTPQWHMYYNQIKASGSNGNWLVVDNSGGLTLRHWVLENSYVKNSYQSDGWEFFDSQGNGPIYVSGDSFVMRINESLDVFLKDYKKIYNVPQENIALK